MEYGNFITRSGADALVPEQVAGEIFTGITGQSAVLSLARRLPNMTAKQIKLPVANTLPMAYFVDGDIGLKKTSKVEWEAKNIVAEEIAVIVPVPDAVFDDAAFDIWSQIHPLVVQAFGKTIDSAILYGEGKPDSWPESIMSGVAANGNVITAGTSLYNDIMGKTGLIAKVEAGGYMVTGYIGAMQARGALRACVDSSGQPIFRSGMADTTVYQLDGANILFPMNGAINPTDSMLIGGDFSQLVYSIRQDLTVRRLTEAVITDSTGAIVYNLPQQDMSALRFVMRLGWALPNPVNAVAGSTRYPFAVLK